MNSFNSIQKYFFYLSSVDSKQNVVPNIYIWTCNNIIKNDFISQGKLLVLYSWIFHNAPKSFCCKIFKVRLTVLGRLQVDKFKISALRFNVASSKWVYSYLMILTTRTSKDGMFSQEIVGTSIAVLQDLSQGPIYFNVFANDLISFINAKMYRSSRRRCSVKKVVLRNFPKFTGKHLCQRLSFNNVAGQGLQLY